MWNSCVRWFSVARVIHLPLYIFFRYLLFLQWLDISYFFTSNYNLRNICSLLCNYRLHLQVGLFCAGVLLVKFLFCFFIISATFSVNLYMILTVFFVVEFNMSDMRTTWRRSRSILYVVLVYIFPRSQYVCSRMEFIGTNCSLYKISV